VWFVVKFIQKLISTRACHAVLYLIIIITIMEKKQKQTQKQARRAKLVLEDGNEYSGWAFGKLRSQAGEMIFNTGMTGYPQLLTDPSLHGQILAATYPLMGNYGAPVKKNGEPFFDEWGIPLNLESERIQAAGLVISELCEEPSHYSSGSTLSAWLEKGNVPGIYGVDTRALAMRLRERGTMRGKILVEDSRDVTLDSGTIANPAADVSGTEVKTLGKGKGPKILLIDCGVKAGVIRNFMSKNVKIIRVPWNHDINGIKYDGLVVCGGPGDPKDCGKTIAIVRKAFNIAKPVFGIGLGNLIMALAAGADTYKLNFGHHGQNQPCVESGQAAAVSRCYMTSQSHSHAVRGETLPRGWEPWFINANDGTIEGIRSVKYPFSAVQFNPEGCPGPRDAEFIIDRFIKLVGCNA
jgi:carbamoyl-phosphate synthase small subunit